METRKRIRLPNYDYSQNGAYFITICTKDKAHTLGTVAHAHVRLTRYGEAVDETIRAIPEVYPNVILEHYVVMPNHIHLLLHLENGPPGCAAPTDVPVVGAEHRPARRASVPQIMSALKSLTTRRCGVSLWQRGYYDHIIRDEEDFLTRWNYIDTNPARWGEDEYA